MDESNFILCIISHLYFNLIYSHLLKYMKVVVTSQIFAHHHLHMHHTLVPHVTYWRTFAKRSAKFRGQDHMYDTDMIWWCSEYTFEKAVLFMFTDLFVHSWGQFTMEIINEIRSPKIITLLSSKMTDSACSCSNVYNLYPWMRSYFLLP